MNTSWLLRSSTLWGVLGASSVLSVLLLWVLPDGVRALRDRESELHEAQVRLLNLNRRNQDLLVEVQKLVRKDPELMEGLARRRGMARSGETVYIFKDRNEGR